MAPVEKPIVYLDTNHISTLARNPEDPGALAVLSLLESGEAVLGLSVFHLLELSDPEFQSRHLVGLLLDDLPVVWGRQVFELFGEEFDRGVALSLGTERAVTCFFEDMEAAFGDSAAAVQPSVAIETIAERPHLREGMMDAKRYGSLNDRIKRDAAVVQRPLEPLIAALRDHGLAKTPSGLSLPRPLDPSDVLEGAGGLQAFPAYQVYTALHRERMGDPNHKMDPNDVLDELHACYGPYVSALVLDRKTAGRVRSARLPMQSKTTRRLDDVPRILANS